MFPFECSSAGDHRGAAYLTPDFNNVKQARLPDIIEQCGSAVEWAGRNAASFGGDPNRVYISGHFSGSLASCVLITDCTKAAAAGRAPRNSSSLRVP